MRGTLFSSLMAVAAIGFQTTAAVPTQLGATAPARGSPPHRTALTPFKEDITGGNPGYYIAWWFAPSGSIVTQFDSTMEVPNLSTDTTIGVSRSAEFHG